MKNRELIKWGLLLGSLGVIVLGRYFENLDLTVAGFFLCGLWWGRSSV